jgi:hypothetical protein
VLRAFFHTFPAVDAKMGFEGYFGFHLPGFDILAPDTAQGAALEKNQAPYPRTVMKTKMLKRKDERINRSHGSSAQ